MWLRMYGIAKIWSIDGRFSGDLSSSRLISAEISLSKCLGIGANCVVKKESKVAC